MPLPPELVDEFPAWRLILEKQATLHDLETSPAWTIERVADACDALDYMAAQQRALSAPPPTREPEVEPKVAAAFGLGGSVRQKRRR